MKKIVCEMCECTEFSKIDGMFVCQECGCRYTAEDARKMMVDIPDEGQTQNVEQTQNVDKPQKETPPEYPPHTIESPNRIAVNVIKVGHETYTASSVMSLSALFGEPRPEFVEGPDVVGNIGAEIEIRNLAGKTIKYIEVYLTPHNSVCDPVQCTVKGHSTYGIIVTGPIEVGDSYQGYCEGMWYNSSICYATIDHADVEFIDGTKERFDATSLTTMEPPNYATFVLSIDFDANAGGVGKLIYSIDGVKQNHLPRKYRQDLYLTPGYHTMNITNPLMNKEYQFYLDSNKTITVYGTSFGFQINE